MKGTMSEGAIRRGEQRVSIRDMDSSSPPSSKCLRGGIFKEFYMHILMNSHSSFLRLNVIVIILNLYVRKRDEEVKPVVTELRCELGKVGHQSQRAPDGVK